MQETVTTRSTDLNQISRKVHQKPPLPEDLTSLQGRTFKKVRHGKTTEAVLTEVGRTKVKLCVAGRKDSFTESTADFRKFYELV